MFKAYCDRCEMQIFGAHSGTHTRNLRSWMRASSTSMINRDVEVVILFREKVPKGDPAEHIHTCRPCMDILLKCLLKGVDDDGEKTKSKVARVSPEWEAP